MSSDQSPITSIVTATFYKHKYKPNNREIIVNPVRMTVPNVIGTALLNIVILLCITGTNGGYFQNEFFENVANHLKESDAIVFNRSESLVRSYDDKLCAQQFGEFLGALGNMRFWAIRGRSIETLDFEVINILIL